MTSPLNRMALIHRGLVCSLGGLLLSQPLTYAQSHPLQLAQNADINDPAQIRREPTGNPPTGRQGGATFAKGVIFIRREPSGSAPGGRYRGGGSRSADPQTFCPTTPIPLTALVPFQEIYEKGRENLPPLVNVWGFTAAERPTFWVYVPYTNPAIPAKFSIDDDEAGVTIYEQAVTLPKQPGIMGIRLPKTAPALQPGKRYRWFFSLSCKSSNATAASLDTLNVEAVVIRDGLKPELKSQLTADASIQNAIAYAQAGFWYDALTTLAELRQQKPQDEAVLQAWKELLSGIATTEKSRQNFKLDDILAQPVVKSER